MVLEYITQFCGVKIPCPHAHVQESLYTLRTRYITRKCLSEVLHLATTPIKNLNETPYGANCDYSVHRGIRDALRQVTVSTLFAEMYETPYGK